MKKFNLLILMSFILLALCGCSATNKKDNDIQSSDKEKQNTGMADPWLDINAEDATKGMTNPFKAPEGAENVNWQTFVSDTPSEQEVKYIQLIFTMNGTKFCAREYEGIAEDADISGMYYEWTATEEDRLSNWGNGGINCKISSHVGDDNKSDAMLLEWYDSDKWIKYSLSATGEDLDGLDLVAIADMMRDK